MENNVTSLETSRKLKAAGFPQDSAYVWVTGDGWAQLHSSSAVKFMPDGAYLELFAAPTAQELADQLEKPFNVRNLSDGRFYAVGHKLMSGNGDTMAEALAALYLKLKEVE